MSGEMPFQPSPEEMETPAQREVAYKGFVDAIGDRFSKESSKILTSGDHQTLHLKSAEGRPFYLERATPNTESKAKTGLIIEEPKAGYDYNTIRYQVEDDGTVTKESFSRKSKSEPEPEGPGEYEDSQMGFNREGDSQMRYSKEMDERLEGTPSQPLSARETDQLTELITQSSPT